MFKLRPASLIAGYFFSVLISAVGGTPEPLSPTSTVANLIQFPNKLVITPITFVVDKNRRNLPGEGVYKAMPYTLLVGVPPAIDPMMVPPSSSGTVAKIQSVEPPMKLIPWRR